MNQPSRRDATAQLASFGLELARVEQMLLRIGDANPVRALALTAACRRDFNALRERYYSCLRELVDLLSKPQASDIFAELYQVREAMIVVTTMLNFHNRVNDVRTAIAEQREEHVSHLALLLGAVSVIVSLIGLYIALR